MPALTIWDRYLYCIKELNVPCYHPNTSINIAKIAIWSRSDVSDPFSLVIIFQHAQNSYPLVQEKNKQGSMLYCIVYRTICELFTHWALMDYINIIYCAHRDCDQYIKPTLATQQRDSSSLATTSTRREVILRTLLTSLELYNYTSTWQCIIPFRTYMLVRSKKKRV